MGSALLLVMIISLCGAEESRTTVAGVEGYSGYYGNCTARGLDQYSGTLEECAQYCRNLWRCEGFVYDPGNQKCRTKYLSCAGKINTDISSPLYTYINQNPLNDYPGNDSLCEHHKGQCVSPQCCPYMYEAEDICTGYPARRCCLHPPDCEWKQKVKELSYWLEGSYAIPRNVYGCPNNETSRVTWLETKAEITIPDDTMATNDITPLTHLPGPLEEKKANFYSCLQSEAVVSDDHTRRRRSWPPGSYCIYKTAGSCPQGFLEGGIEVANTSLQVKMSSSLSVVNKTGNSSFNMAFCCRDDRHHILTANFPTPQPFSLIKFGTECQNVLYMVARSDVIHLGLDPGAVVKTTGLVPTYLQEKRGFISLSFCHYKEYERCFQAGDSGRTYHGFVNVSQAGTCLNWRDYSSWFWEEDDEPQLHNSIVDNWCTGIRSLNPRVFCVLERYEEYGACAIPACEDFRQYEGIQERKISFPSRQGLGPFAEPYLALDGDINSCSKQEGYRPWWQINLLTAETIYGLETNDRSGGRGSWYAFDIYVGMSPLDFLDQTALACIKDYWGYGIVLIFQCLKPVVGQYITLRQGLWDPWYYVDGDGKRNKLQLCEVMVYSKATQCGHTYGRQDIDPHSQVTVSSSDSQEDMAMTNVVLHAPHSWCAAHNDLTPYLMLDLLFTRQVSGLWTQGSPDITEVAMVTGFSLHYGYNVDYLVPYLEDGVIKEFSTGPDPHDPIHHPLLTPIRTRIIKLRMSSWIGQACFRFAIIGCLNTKENLVLEGSVSGQQGERVTDNRRETCSALSADGKFHFSLKREVTVHDVIIRLSQVHRYNATILVAMSDVGNDASVCGTVHDVTSAIVGVRCSGDVRGRFITVTMTSGVDLCEVEVYGTQGVSASSADMKSTISCGSGQEVEPVSLTPVTTTTMTPNSPYSHKVRLSAETFGFLARWCGGRSESCTLSPDLTGGRTGEGQEGGEEGTGGGQADLEVSFSCASLSALDIGKCVWQVDEPGPLELTGQYLRMYGTIQECSWRITAPPNQHVAILIKQFKMAERETSFMDGTHFTDVGTCVDRLLVRYGLEGDNGGDQMEVTGQQSFLSPGRWLTLSLLTCYRHVYVTPDINILINVEFTDCPGCAVLTSCSGVSFCRADCGRIQSPGFPLIYSPNQKCSWRITVKSTAFIRLVFGVFDVFEERSEDCERDAVDVFEFDRDGENRVRMGRYCNTFLPPDTLETGWNQMQIDFFTDGSDGRSGFQADYSAQNYDISNEGDGGTGDSVCKPGWKSFNSTCFQAFKAEEAVTWFEAEKRCREMDSWLGTVHSEQEMRFLNILLISVYDMADAYIGLTDRENEGVFMWTDGLPITYSNWIEYEPNGGSIEDCGQVSLNGIGAAPSWKDVPCAAATLKNYICSYSTKTVEVSNPLLVLEGGGPCEDEQLFTCSSGECILAVFVCDGVSDCHNSTDEQDCGVTCSDSYFTCGDGSCISLTFLCDGRPDCEDLSDEAFCDYPDCGEDEFTCQSHECVPQEARCDQLQHCQDGSDELKCDTCSEQMFQCYDGTCISRLHLCDSYGDCPGLLREDESSSVCKDSLPSSCLEWRQRGYTENRRYTIQKGEDQASVTCDMTSHPGFVVTMIHHNNEALNVSFHGFENPATYRRNLTYFASWDLIYHVRSVSARCEMFMEAICWNAEAFAKSWWVGADDIRYWYSEDVYNDGCKCHLRKTCEEIGGTNLCYCSKPDRDILYVDRGYFTVTERLPIRQLTMEDTGGSHETVSYTIGSFDCYQEFEKGSSSLRCKSGQSYTSGEACLYRKDQYGYPKGCRDVTHLENCEAFECPPTYYKCPSSYCVSANLVCDGSRDCPNGEDENKMMCERLTCPGMLACRQSPTCVPDNQRCDGVRDCPLGDDEWYCDVTCPEGCTCIGLNFNCSALSLVAPPIGLSHKARALDIQENVLELDLWNNTISEMVYLTDLNLARNGLYDIPTGFFLTLSNLRVLDLSGNVFVVLRSGLFLGLKNLISLHLSGNPLRHIESGAFNGLDSLPLLIISNMFLENITSGALGGLYSLESLDMSRNQISELEAGLFDDLKNIKDIKMYANRITSFKKGDFENLPGLESMHSDDYMFCCFVSLEEGNCLPSKDLLSSCEDLMENNILRSFLWILGLMAFVGNTFVFLYRTTASDSERVTSVLIRNLSMADLLMGLYMLTIAGVDTYYRGVYIENSLSWKESIGCQVLGCLSTIASEASVLTLGAITIDRLINILFPLSTRKLNGKSVRYVLAIIWLFTIVMALVPLIPGPYFQGTYYSRSGVCVSLYITSEKTPGWEYSFAIFHGLNLAVFILIFVAYAYMYKIIKSSSAIGAGDQKKREMTAARKMTLIVVTDFCCWIPINIMGFLALNGTEIPGSIYAWTVVFILPVNSALNPILYTISSIRFPWQKQAPKEEGSTRLTWTTEKTSMIIGHKDTMIGGNLDQWMKSPHNQDPKTAARILHQVATLIKDLHSDGLYLGQLETSTVLMGDEKAQHPISLSGCPLPQDMNAQGQTYDIELFGKLVSRLLRALTVARKK